MYMRKLTRPVLYTPDSPVTTVEQGALRGVQVEGTYIFRGVPYAKSGRFMPPSPPDKWDGIRAAENFGPACRTLYIPQMPDADYAPRYYYPESETCQFLNIWTPTLERDARRPVLVWLHGNGWTSGSSMELYAADGENFAAHHNAVVVGLNHRLNMLGSADLRALGDKYPHSSHAGLMDIVAALRWLHDNISAFGGDPGNITLLGHSGGAEKVLALLQCPAADGLYHKVILDNAPNAPEETPPQQLADAEQFGALLLDRLAARGCSPAEAESVDWYELADSALEALWLFRQQLGRDHRFRPTPDGEYYTGHPLQVGLRPTAAKIPVLIGRAGKVTGTDAALAAAFSQQGCPTWLYGFELTAPYMGGAAPWHGADVAYAFMNAAYIESLYVPDESEKAEARLSGAWAAFISKGDPNHSALPRWDAFTQEANTVMVIDNPCHTESAPPNGPKAEIHPLLDGVVYGISPLKEEEGEYVS